MLKKFLNKNWQIVIVVLIAAFLRLYKIGDYMEFLGDQGRDVVVIKDFWKSFNLFFIGPQTSIGDMYLGPFFYYLIAPSLLLANFSPIGPAVFIALLNIFTVILIYYISNRWFDKKTAIISSFLFAISPVVIKYSNFIWNPNIMPFFSLLFIYFFFEAFLRKNYKLFIYASLSFVMVMNSHYLGLALLPFTGLYYLFKLITFAKNKSSQFKPFIKYSFIAVFVFILSLTPQVLFDLKHNGQNTKALIKFFTHREGTVNIKVYKAIPKLPSIFNLINTNLLAGKNENLGIYISLIFVIAIAVYILINKDKLKSKKFTYFWIIFFWYFSGVTALALYKQHVYPHYFSFLFPTVFILFGYLTTRYKYFGYIAIALVTYLSLLNNPLRYPANHQLETVNKIANLIIDNSSNQEFNFSLLAKQNYDPPYRYVLSNKKAKIVDLPNNLATQLFVVCETFQIDCNPINNPEWSVAAFGWAKIENQWEVDGIIVYKLVHL